MRVADEHELVRKFEAGGSIFALARKYDILLSEVEEVIRTALKEES